MIVEVSTVRQKNGKKGRSLSNTIYALQSSGRIGTYTSEDGYCAYDPEELERYKKTVRHGRPMTRKKKEE